MIKSKKAIKLKDGSTLPAGSPVVFDSESTTICYVAGKRVRITSAFVAPSIAKMEQWNSEGGCKTPAGEWTEPDGYGESGAPSWLMVLGLI
ncbi:MAG: hypothetical protein WCH21_03640 [Bacteroidota bacterium]|jgi:hypothetical protein